MNTCKNCANQFEEQYCNRCGQKEAGRITVNYLTHQAIHAAVHADMGIFPFMKKLLFTPGILARDYIDGKRKIFNPIQFLFLTLALTVSLMAVTSLYSDFQQIQPQSNPAISPQMQAKMNAINGLITKHSNLFSFIMIPIFAFFTRKLFRAGSLNYAEHFMLMILTISQINIFTIIALCIAWAAGLGMNFIMLSSIFIFLFSFTHVFTRFFSISPFVAFSKGVLTYILTMLIFAILMGIFTFIYLLF